MEKQDLKIKRWVEEAIKKKYSATELYRVLVRANYTPQEIQEILDIFNVVRDEEMNENLKSLGWGSESFKSNRTLDVEEVSKSIEKVKKEISKIVVGQKTIIDSLIMALMCDGHVLMEGVPGTAKTLIIKTLSRVIGCDSKRVQFTVDLLPSDIVGITSYTPERGYEVIKGPVFTNFLVADEINRSPPKTQSALIQAMQEKQVTIGKKTYDLPSPFFVMANNNPLENEGVYALPEAQIDRFLFKLLIEYPEANDEMIIMAENMTLKNFEDFDIKPILSPEKIIEIQKLTKRIYVDEKVKRYIVNLVQKTRAKDFESGKYIDYGGSPRATIALFIASKAQALINGRDYVIPRDVQDVIHNVLRHRLILTYKARAEGVSSDKIINDIVKLVEVI